MPELTAGAEPARSSAHADVYDRLAPPDRVWLRRVAAHLRVRLRRNVAGVLRAGRVLSLARRRLGRGLWLPWLSSEAGIPRRTASRFIAVHRVFGTVPPEVLARFTPTALYTLVEPGTPQPLREYAVEQAAGGTEVTDRVVGEWLAAYRDPCPGGTRQASRDGEPDADPREVFAESNWFLLENLLSAGGTTVHLSRTVDAENDDPTVTGVCLGPAGARRATGSTLEQVVLALGGAVRAKVCPRCPPEVGPRPLDQFSKRKDKPDGRNRYCLQCEAARVRTYAREKSAAKCLVQGNT